MKLAVSNIAWTDALDGDALALLQKHPVSGVEVAPTRLWPGWTDMSVAAAQTVREQFGEAGFRIPSMQSLLFGLPHLNVFGDEASRTALSAHMDRLFPVASALGVRALVFGSPRNRDRSGLSDTEAFDRAVAFFRQLGQAAEQHEVVLCVEPNPAQYGANFVTNWREALALVTAVDTPGFGLHLDTGCIHMNGDDPAQAIRESRDAICHFHVSEPSLADFSAPQVNHRAAAQALRDVGYDRWISIEMRSGEQPLTALDAALGFVTGAYLDGEATA